jgi:hypothetical protein
MPTKWQQIIIDPTNVTGNPPMPLILHFDKIFLRQQNASEHYLVLTAQDLQNWSVDVWAALA